MIKLAFPNKHVNLVMKENIRLFYRDVSNKSNIVCPTLEQELVNIIVRYANHMQVL
jgi:hypothetical protein